MTTLYAHAAHVPIVVLTCFQLFLEEEREREMEQLYEDGLADNYNREDEAIGSGAPDAETTQTPEATNVSKQTTETLMAGEKLIEALELADAEREAFAAYEEAKSKVSETAAAKIPAPTKNAVLAAYDMEPDEYVLMTIEKIHNSALMDALLVLPFSRVLSLMVYLAEWARKVANLSL